MEKIERCWCGISMKICENKIEKNIKRIQRKWKKKIIWKKGY